MGEPARVVIDGIEPLYADEQVLIYHGDALVLLPKIPTSSVHLILVDPPYFRVKMDYLGESVSWDRQWISREVYLEWLRRLAQEWQRILTPNGSLYCFASPQMAAHVEVMLGEVFHVIQQITWRKPPFSTKAEMFDKDIIRMFFPASEAIVFCEQQNADSMALGESGYAAQCEQLRGFVFEPIRAYLEGERLRAGIPRTDCNTACGVVSMADRHYFGTSQWQLPTREHYASLQYWFNAHGRHPAPAFADYHPAGSAFAKFHRTSAEFLRTDYESLRTDYESLRRPFSVSQQVPYTDIWDFATVQAYAGKHPCEKPPPLLRHIITASSRPGDTVLDCMAGSGSTLEAARQCGRKGIAIEQDEQWVQRMVRRMQQTDFFAVIPPAPTPVAPTQPALFALERRTR